MAKFSDIPLFPRSHYEVDVSWVDLEHTIQHYTERDGLNLEPEFQRAHVWTRAQQVAYVEYILRGGEVGKSLTFNCPGWQLKLELGPYEIVDGKQRMEAVRAFMRDDFRAFGHLRSEYTDHIRLHVGGFKWRICSLETRAEVLELYLNINAGGTPHTKKELARVRAMLDLARKV
jgi:hypothetical protein